MKNSSTRIVDLCNDLTDWFWDHGKDWDSQFALRPEDWLERLYTVRETAKQIIASRNTKKTMALWGPSQAGKSTLISAYVDSQADEKGVGSALHWDGGVPARFSKFSDTTGLALNPHNLGSDASGCITRFTLRDSVADPSFPVELRMANPWQCAHALTLGYLSECNLENSQGEVTMYGLDIFLKAVDLAVGENDNCDPSHDVYEALFEFANLLDRIINSGVQRFRNLRSKKSAVRKKILSVSSRVQSVDNVIDLLGRILWDDHKPLNDAFKQLRNHCENLQSNWSGKRIFCTIEVASLLLDIDSFAKFCKGNSDVIAKLQRLSFDSDDARVRIGLEQSKPLIHGRDDFGLLQGLVLELIVPLRKDIVSEGSPHFHQFLETADLLDFPGVAREDANSERTLKDLKNLPNDERHEIFTDILKRGKTAAIVSTYSNELTIDGFTILTRIQDFPRKPQQLLSGIIDWIRCYSPQYSPDENARSPLPLNLMLTFCQQFVVSIMDSGVSDSLAPVFKRLRKLDLISDPDVVWETFTTNYPQFLSYQFPPNSTGKLELAATSIKADDHFRKQFPSDLGIRSFDSMLVDGGTEIVFEEFERQMSQFSRAPLLTKRWSLLPQTIDALVSEALPQGVELANRRKKILKGCRSRISKLLQSSKSDEEFVELSVVIRDLINCQSENLDPLPREIRRGQGPEATELWVKKQLGNWISHKLKNETTSYQSIGFANEGDLGLALSSFTDAISTAKIAKWIERYFGGLRTVEDRLRARHFVAVRISNEVLNLSSVTHNSPETVQQRFEFFSNYENSAEASYKRSPHVYHIIKPFHDRLGELIENGHHAARPEMPGDGELKEILKKYRPSTNGKDVS